MTRDPGAEDLLREAEMLKTLRARAQTQNWIFDEITAERARQMAKFGTDQAADPLLMAAILTEEVGEVAQACLTEKPEIPANRYTAINCEHLRDELIQVAAVAVAWLEHIQLEGLRDTRDS